MKLQPSSINSEKIILGSLIAEEGMNLNKVSKLNTGDFYKTSHQEIFKAIKGLRELGIIADLPTVAEEIERTIGIKAIGGQSYLMEVFDCGVAKSSLTHHVNLVLEKSVYRKVIALTSQINSRCYDGEIGGVNSLLRELSDKTDSLLRLNRFNKDQEIFNLTDREQCLDELRKSNGLSDKGVSPGWDSLHNYYPIRKHEWTLVTGIPGHGKSDFIDAIACNLVMEQGWKFGIFSPENSPFQRKHVPKLMQKLADASFREGKDRMGDNVYQHCKQVIKENFFFVEPSREGRDNFKIDYILDLAAELIERKGIDGFVIDPWNELDHSRPSKQSETEYISEALTKIRYFARHYGIHIWLVAHPTKLQKGRDGKYPIPTPYDVSGSAHWNNKADNALTIYRELSNNSVRNVTWVCVSKIRFQEWGKIGIVRLVRKTTGKYIVLPSNLESYYVERSNGRGKSK